MDMIQASWVDLVILGLLGFGMVRGRTRGMSQEVLDLLKWLFAVLLSIYLYKPIGGLLAEHTPLTFLHGYLITYTLIILTVYLIFSKLKTAYSERIVEKDAFGDGEYYLGIFSGLLRYCCVILILMNFLHARHYFPYEANARVESQMKDFGMVFFTVPGLQKEVFQQSVFGRFTSNTLIPFMVEPTPAQDKDIDRYRRSVRARERRR